MEKREKFARFDWGKSAGRTDKIKVNPMPTVLTETPVLLPPPEPPRKKWTRVECAVLQDSGFFDGQSLELVEGELISKMGKKRPHVNSSTLLAIWLMQTFGPLFVNQEAPIDVAPEDNPTNEPLPDVIVLKRELSYFLAANPQPEDLQLVVEVADTSRNFGLTTKAALYARAGIGEYWVLDVPGRRLLVHREPKPGRYAFVVAYSEEESVAPLAMPQKPFRIG
ncbi:MAG: Uma2 family endonuclease, partial [Acidobacteriaceae bacterium]|nr:Uma2 family endonuclease [Acidobacteriaceae bacterium]